MVGAILPGATQLPLPLDRGLLVAVADGDKADTLEPMRLFERLGFKIYTTESTKQFLAEHGVDLDMSFLASGVRRKRLKGKDQRTSLAALPTSLTMNSRNIASSASEPCRTCLFASLKPSFLTHQG
jgi:hypothetical protein